MLAFAISDSNGQPQLQAAEIIKESEKRIVLGSAQSGWDYRTHIKPEEVERTPKGAWQRFLDKKKAEQHKLAESLDKISKHINFAEKQVNW